STFRWARLPIGSASSIALAKWSCCAARVAAACRSRTSCNKTVSRRSILPAASWPGPASWMQPSRRTDASNCGRSVSEVSERAGRRLQLAVGRSLLKLNRGRVIIARLCLATGAREAPTGTNKMTLRARILAACGLSLFAGVLQAADLLSVYERALQNDPQIREADANRLASRESKPQALAALLPQLNATGSYSDVSQDFSRTTLTPENPADPNSDLAARDISTDSDYKARRYDVTLTQPLFHWDQWAALRSADAQVAQAEADYQAAQQDLILRTSQRYFDVLAAQDTVDAAQATLEAFSRQLEQADKRFEVGLIAITDVQEARAAHDQAAAAVIQAKRALATANELLRELTGESFDTLAGPIDDLPRESPAPADEEQWVTHALDQNLRVVSARLATDIAKQDVSVARAGHLPSIDIVASRQDQDFNGTQVGRNGGGEVTPRSPADQNQKNDSIGVQVTVPIYSGGATSSRVRQRVYLHRAARERLERTNRETER